MCLGIELRITAFIGVRNQVDYLRRTIPYLLQNGIGIVLIDNGSNDGVRSLAEKYQVSGADISFKHLPFKGHFDLRQQLEEKSKLIAGSDADWVMHLDADEMPHSRCDHEALSAALIRADQAGYNAIDFDEFVFLPIRPVGIDSKQLLFPFSHYYLFKPSVPRLMRAWRRDSGLTNVTSGGHMLEGDTLKLSPESLILRHYPFLSQEHAYTKYAKRQFSALELSLGWHSNRIGIETSRFEFPSPEELQLLHDVGSHKLDYSRPRRLHYWEWPKTSLD